MEGFVSYYTVPLVEKGQVKGELELFHREMMEPDPDVDVWDALKSDRPYRQAWSKERALEYMRSQAGKHFDPKVVETFIQLIRGE